MSDKRIEKDSLGEVEVPESALWAAQTQRAVDNFPVSGHAMPIGFIQAVVRIKRSAARANAVLGLLDGDRAHAIEQACDRVLSGAHEDQFPVDVYQTGSGTSTNMNVNEVIARLATEQSPEPVNPNDHVNMSQSSNDVIPTAIHLSAVTQVHEHLLPALDHLATTIQKRESETESVVKTGRTHLMDAMPVTMAQELRTWREQIGNARTRLENAATELLKIPQGGTAVGTGVNAHADFARLFAEELSALTDHHFTAMEHPFVGQSAIDAPVGMSAAYRGLATVFMKMANDLRWMNSGPIHGLGEITLPALQPGSSIMPGKVNPVIPESAAMVAAQVTGLDTAVNMAGQSGNFQLNVMLPLVGWNLLEMNKLLSNTARLMADKAIAGFTVNSEVMAEAVGKNPVLVTTLNPVIGYAKAAEVAKKAYATGQSILDVAKEETDVPEAELRDLLDPIKQTRGGLPDA
ncbi:fumarase class II [Halospina denitrificans]|uniref:Fumarate hydratase class II n=1 Tax=Halospina denitrificans TaxID=332522 RepID=A0A4R7JPQ9_9GAMM|nr:class II fumarate hydratase [Halospina denitrificans]TDT40141.1 fumarase class II [Halospina denitrificans]